MTDNIKLPPLPAPAFWVYRHFDQWEISPPWSGYGTKTPARLHTDETLEAYAREAVRLNAAPAQWFAGWLVSNSEGDDEFINNPTALHGRHYKGGAPLLLQVASTAEPRGNAEVAHHPV